MHPHITKFISSQQTESSEIRERIFNLGKALVEELGLDPGVDTLARWMVHYVAEQMTLAENATGEEKTKAKKQCFETILKLWHHRSYYPNGRRPFENFESIFRTLERIDPDNSSLYFYSTKPDDSPGDTDDVQQWLDIALGIDEAARVWLEQVFHQAALNATNEKTRIWLENSIGLPKSDDVLIITRLLDFDQAADSEAAIQQAEQAKQEKIESRIKKLDSFIEFSQILRAGFVDELGAISSSSNMTSDTADVDSSPKDSDDASKSI